MAAYSPKRLYQGQPTASYAAVYTVPGATSCIIKEVVICNPTSGSMACDVSFVASGGTAGVSNNVIANAVIPAYTTVIYSFSQVLATGGFISAKSGTTTTLTLTISGVEFA